MTRAKLTLSLIAIASLILLVVIMAGGFKPKVAPALSDIPTPNLNSVAVKSVTMIPKVWLPANLSAKHNTQVSSRIMASVEKVYVRAGDMVKAGEVIAELDKKELQAQVADISAQIESVSAQLAQASLQLARSKQLQKDGLISVNELDTAKATYEQLFADKQSKEQQKSRAQVTLAYTRIVAPISGKVVDRLVEPGDLVSAGQPIVALYNPTSMQISSFVPESLAVTLTLGDVLQVEIKSLETELFATVSEIVPQADSAARSFEVKLDFQQAATSLIPGMYARIGVEQHARNILVIDPKYIRHFGQLTKVKVLEQGVITERFIRVGKHISENQVEVISGLKQGDLIL